MYACMDIETHSETLILFSSFTLTCFTRFRSVEDEQGLKGALRKGPPGPQTPRWRAWTSHSTLSSGVSIESNGYQLSCLKE